MSGQATAQKYSEGKIVTNDGDTVHCKIKIAKWDINPRKIVTIHNEKTKRYWATEIASFEAANRTFVSARVRLDVSNHLDGTLDLEDSQPKFVNDSIFAELIVRGTKNLYRYKSPGFKEHFLIAENDQLLQALIYKRFHVWTVVSGKMYKQVVYNEEYKNQLETFFSDCPGFKAKITRTGYEIGQLSSLFALYYNCSK
jgi:hypothetical protein